MLKRGRLDDLREALELIAWWNGKQFDWDEIGFEDESGKKSVSKHKRRPDKAENVLKITGLPSGTGENTMRKWLARNLTSEMSGLIYHCAVEQAGEVCYVSFITHKLMLDAKKRLRSCQFHG